jgi:hypothetical protein
MENGKCSILCALVFSIYVCPSPAFASSSNTNNNNPTTTTITTTIAFSPNSKQQKPTSMSHRPRHGERGEDDAYKTAPHTGESSSYFNPANTFPDEPSRPHAPPGGYQEGGGGGGGGAASHGGFPNALHHAQHHSSASTSPSLFSTALQHLGQMQKTHDEAPAVDDSAFVSAHQKIYSGSGSGSGSGDTQAHGAPTLGMAAAMNALKTFTAGGQEGKGSGNSQGEFIGLAMAQASKLFDEQSHAGNVVRSLSLSLSLSFHPSIPPGLLHCKQELTRARCVRPRIQQAASTNKQDAVSQAAHMAYKLYTKSGSGGGGGPGGLLGKLL